MALDPEALMDKTIMAVLTAFVQVILLATVFIPTAIDMIEGMVTEKYKEIIEGYKPLLYAVVTVTVISVVIGIIMTYVRRS